MTQLRLNPDGSFARTNGQLTRVEGLESVRQHLQIRLRLIRGEVPTDLSRGMRYVGLMLGKGIAPERREGEVVEVALGTPGVVSVDAISLEIADRVATIVFDGTVSLSDARRRVPLHDRFTVEI